MMLRTLLWARSAFLILFGAALLVLPQLDALPEFQRGGVYAVVDGVLVLAFAVALLYCGQRWLFPLVFVDGLAHLIAGAIIIAHPQMHLSPIGSVLFLAVAVVVFVFIGLAGSVFVLLKRPASEAARSIVPPALTMSLSTLVLGVGLGFAGSFGAQRMGLAAYTIGLGIALAWAGLRFGQRNIHE